MNSIYNISKISLAGICLASLFWVSCQPDKYDDGGNGLGVAPEASFTVTAVEGRQNTYVLKANAKAIAVKWDKGDGSGSNFGKPTDTAFYPDAGNYTITLTAIGKGGLTATKTQTVNVASNHPVAGNKILNGKFDDGNTGWNIWTKGANADVKFENGKVHFTHASGWDGRGIYTTVSVEAGKTYLMNMHVSGGGATDSWFEVYMGKAAPVNGVDYSPAPGTLMGLSTWNGCGNAPYNGKLASIGCTGTLQGKGGEIKFAEGGTYYFLIRTGAGGSLGPNGIFLDDVEFRLKP